MLFYIFELGRQVHLANDEYLSKLLYTQKFKISKFIVKWAVIKNLLVIIAIISIIASIKYLV